MSATPSSMMAAPATSIPAAPSTSLYGSGAPPQQLLQKPMNIAPPSIAHAGGVSGVPMAMTSGMATAGGVVAPLVSTTSSTPAVAMTTTSGGIGMPAAPGGAMNASVASGTVGGGVGGGGTPNAGTEKKKKKKKVRTHVHLYPCMGLTIISFAKFLHHTRNFYVQM